MIREIKMKNGEEEGGTMERSKVTRESREEVKIKRVRFTRKDK